MAASRKPNVLALESNFDPSSGSLISPRNRRPSLAINGKLFLLLDRVVQCEAAVGTLNVAQRVPRNSDARTTPGACLRLGANPQRAMASRTPYAAKRQQHDDDRDWKRRVERPWWNPCHPLQDVRRNQAGKEEGHNYAPDNSVLLIEVFAHRFHGARFYSLWSAAQCSRQIMALHRLVEAYSAMGDSHYRSRRLDSMAPTPNRIPVDSRSRGQTHQRPANTVANLLLLVRRKKRKSRHSPWRWYCGLTSKL